MKIAQLGVIALFLAGTTLSGCGLIAAGAAGGVVADEMNEEDGTFDPLENTDAGEAVYE